MDQPDIVHKAEEAIDEHTEPEHGRKYADGDDRASLRREQQDEAAETWVGPGAGAMTDGQWKGLLAGSLIGGIIGAVVFLPLALVPFTDNVALRLLVVALAGALAGGTAGALYQGGRQPELEGETLDRDGRGSDGTTLRDPGTDDRGR
jgi:hypothetical protein